MSSTNSRAQDIDTAFFNNTSSTLSVQINGTLIHTGMHYSRIEQATNNVDSVYIDIYWKECYGFQMVVPFDTLVPLTITTPPNFTLRIRSYVDANASPLNCPLRSLSLIDTYYLNYTVLGIEEHLSIPKIPIKIVDFLGRETEDNQNSLLIIQYSDGTIEKVFHVEP